MRREPEASPNRIGKSSPHPPRSYFELLERKYARPGRPRGPKGTRRPGPRRLLLPWLTVVGGAMVPLLFLVLGWPWVPGEVPEQRASAEEPPPPWSALPTLGGQRAEQALSMVAEQKEPTQPAQPARPALSPRELEGGSAPAFTANTGDADSGDKYAADTVPEPRQGDTDPARDVSPGTTTSSGTALPRTSREPVSPSLTPAFSSGEERGPPPKATETSPGHDLEPPEVPRAEPGPGALSGDEILATGPVMAEPPDVPPSRLVSPMPAYPREAWVHGIQGDVQLRTWIDEEGVVTAIEVVRGLPHGLTEAAVAAVARWRFRPALRGGRPIAAEHALSIRFAL